MLCELKVEQCLSLYCFLQCLYLQVEEVWLVEVGLEVVVQYGFQWCLQCIDLCVGVFIEFFVCGGQVDEVGGFDVFQCYVVYLWVQCCVVQVVVVQFFGDMVGVMVIGGQVGE